MINWLWAIPWVVGIIFAAGWLLGSRIVREHDKKEAWEKHVDENDRRAIGDNIRRLSRRIDEFERDYYQSMQNSPIQIEAMERLEECEHRLGVIENDAVQKFQNKLNDADECKRRLDFLEKESAKKFQVQRMDEELSAQDSRMNQMDMAIDSNLNAIKNLGDRLNNIDKTIYTFLYKKHIIKEETTNG